MSLHISKQLPVRPVQPADSSMGADEISNASHSFIASFSLPNDKVPVEVVGHCPQPRCIPNIQPMASKQTGKPFSKIHQFPTKNQAASVQ